MVRTCSAYGCTSRAMKGGVHIFRFPKDLERKKQWEKALRRKNFSATKCSGVCELHFQECDIRAGPRLRLKLERNAVPSVFKGFPPYLQQKKKGPCQVLSRKSPVPVSSTSSGHKSRTQESGINVKREEEMTYYSEMNFKSEEEMTDCDMNVKSEEEMTDGEINVSGDEMVDCDEMFALSNMNVSTMLSSSTSSVFKTPTQESDINVNIINSEEETTDCNEMSPPSITCDIQKVYFIPKEEFDKFQEEKKELEKMRIQYARNLELKKKVKTLQQIVRRKDEKISNLLELIKPLQEKKLVDEQLKEMLKKEFGEMTGIIIQNVKDEKSKSKGGHRYCEDFKKFALTLYDNSPKAYNYCRSILKLPHPSSLHNWKS